MCAVCFIGYQPSHRRKRAQSSPRKAAAFKNHISHKVCQTWLCQRPARVTHEDWDGSYDRTSLRRATVRKQDIHYIGQLSNNACPMNMPVQPSLDERRKFADTTYQLCAFFKQLPPSKRPMPSVAKSRHTPKCNVDTRINFHSRTVLVSTWSADFQPLSP